ncbi:MAG: acylglycerol kinase family protein, partial [Acidobacteria bacterium]|nr:acylglycerol kinase family protein [Acidobacteriota bacterium]
MRLAIIANPSAGGGRVYRRLQRLLRDWPYSGWKVELESTSGPGHAEVLARGLLGDPPDLLAVCGGDGTYNEVVNGIPDPPFPVAIVPAGTGNVLARDIGVPLGTSRAIEVALEMNVRRVDLGVLTGTRSRAFL